MTNTLMPLPEGGITIVRFRQRRLKRTRKCTWTSIGSLMGLLVAAIVMIWSLYMSLFSARVMDQINLQLEKLNTTKQPQDELLDLHKQSYVNPKRILLVGLIASPGDLYEDHSVFESIEKLCSAYCYKNDQDGHIGFVEIQILYRDKNAKSKSIVSLLDEKFKGAGCRVNFMIEDTLLMPKEAGFLETDLEGLSRYKKIARLRSLQRRYILSKHSPDDFDAVINVDLDVVQFPPIYATIEAIRIVVEAAQTSTGRIICANGYETLTIASLFRRKQYYDTFAAIDIDGRWYYTDYAASLWQMITFGQTNLFRDILYKHPDLWPMQTCFGGLAIYDFPSWSNKDCDYDQGNVKLKRTETTKDRRMTVFERQIRQRFESTGFWKIPPQYTRDLSPNGDVCEHVVFQQCLRVSALAHGKPVPEVGVQPNLLIGREAAVLTRSEDKVNFGKKIFIVFLLLLGSSLVVKRWLRQSSKTPMRRLSFSGHYHNA